MIELNFTAPLASFGFVSLTPPAPLKVNSNSPALRFLPSSTLAASGVMVTELTLYVLVKAVVAFPLVTVATSCPEPLSVTLTVTS